MGEYCVLSPRPDSELSGSTNQRKTISLSYGASLQGSQFQPFSMCGVLIKDDEAYER